MAPGATAAAAHATPDSRKIAAAIRAIPSAWFKPDPRVYWPDMLASALAGWTAFVFSVLAADVRLRAALLIVAVFALYRAVLFIHELTHLAARELPAFRAVWNALVGVPMLIPSFLYEGVHTDHHRQRSYGTIADPEYIPFGRRPPILIATYALGSLFVPVALAFRFGVLAPLSWIVPPLRRVTVDRCSALVINHEYVRQAPMDRAALVEEIASSTVVWTSIGLWWAGVLPGATFLCWLIVTGVVSTINAVRTLAAHRYDHDEGVELSDVTQLLDTCTLAPEGGIRGWTGTAWRVLCAPVGLRYHALHHWIPSLPYHNLGRAHRLLVSTLTGDAPYIATQHRAIAPLVADLIRRARNRARA
jgi:fatty acid desaturase